MAVVVTGAAQGIGEAVARRLAGCGARLALIDRQEDRLRAVADDIEAISCPGDLCEETSIEAAMTSAIRRLGQIEGLVNVAGVQTLSPLLDQTADEFDTHYQVNLRGTWLATRMAARLMIPEKQGAIVTVSSNAARIPRMHQGAYCASKAGISHLMRVFALELGRSGIRVNTVAPGATETPMIRRMMDEMGFGEEMLRGSLENFRVGVPLQRNAMVEDVADAVIWLLSDMARHVTMHELIVDGGATLGA